MKMSEMLNKLIVLNEKAEREIKQKKRERCFVMTGVAQSNKDDYTYFCHYGYFLVRFKEQLRGKLFEKVPFLIGEYNDEKLKQFEVVLKLNKKIKGYKPLKKIPSIDVLTEYLAKWIKKYGKEENPVIKLNEYNYVDARYLKMIYTLLGDDIKIKVTDKKSEPIRLSGKYGIAILCCVNLSEARIKELFRKA